MKEGTFIILTISELRKELADYYKKVLIDSASEILAKGNTLVPAAIMDGGIDALSLDELVESSQDWFESEHSDADVVMLYDEKTKELTVLKNPYSEEETKEPEPPKEVKQ